jgi:hypothetical protein
VNSWEGWAAEPQYGEAARWARLERAALVAGERVASGAINAPKQSQRRAVRGAARADAAAPPTVPAMVAAHPPVVVPILPSSAPPVPVATAWAQIAQLPGISPLATASAADPI